MQREHYAAGGILDPEKMSPLTYAHAAGGDWSVIRLPAVGVLLGSFSIILAPPIEFCPNHRPVLRTSDVSAAGVTRRAWCSRRTGRTPATLRNEQALRIDPFIATAHRGLAILLAASDRRQAIHHAREAVRIERNADNLNNLGIVIAEMAPKEAEDCFQGALSLDDRFEAARLNLENLLATPRGRAEAPLRPFPASASPATRRPVAERAAQPATTAP